MAIPSVCRIIPYNLSWKFFLSIRNVLKHISVDVVCLTNSAFTLIILVGLGHLCALYIIYIYLLLVACRSEKEMNRRKDMLANLRSKTNQMASALNMSNFANRDSLLGPEIKPADVMSRSTGLDNHGLVGFQRQIMRGRFICFNSFENFYRCQSLLM